MTKKIDGTMPVNYIYTAGIAGEEFLLGLKKGKILGNKCKCGRSYVPLRLFCEECFSRIEKTFDAGLNGKLYSFTSVNLDIEGQKIEEKIVGLIDIRGSKFVHRISGPPKKIKFGAKVKAIFKSPQERKGSINDIKWFEVV